MNSWLNHREERGHTGSLFLDEYQLAVFDFEVFHIIGQLDLIMLFCEFFLQDLVHQRRGHGEIADLDLCGIEGGITIFGAEMSGQGEVDVSAPKDRKSTRL